MTRTTTQAILRNTRLSISSVETIRLCPLRCSRDTATLVELDDKKAHIASAQTKGQPESIPAGLERRTIRVIIRRLSSHDPATLHQNAAAAHWIGIQFFKGRLLSMTEHSGVEPADWYLSH